jgi:Leucine-rich repeat (LRR) protein
MTDCEILHAGIPKILNDCCIQAGITCDENNRILKVLVLKDSHNYREEVTAYSYENGDLNLRIIGLEGIIPENIGLLDKLQIFKADGAEIYWKRTSGKLRGPIPESICLLTNLEGLFLANNVLTNSIPSCIGSLVLLKTLELHENELTGPIPDSIGRMVNLEIAYFHGNTLISGIPESITKLVKLQEVNLSNNELTGLIPTALGDLTQLQKLDLSTNLLAGGIPKSIFDIQTLTHLYLDHNDFIGDIHNAGSAKSLTWLSLEGNAIDGEIPATISNLVDLVYLNLGSNELTGQIRPSSISSMGKLRILLLNNNQLSGNFPSGIVNLHRLEVLSIAANAIGGRLPSNIGNLLALDRLDVANNLFVGQLPKSLGLMVRLKELTLHRDDFGNVNTFSGYLPRELKSLVNLEILSINVETLAGPLPDLSNYVNLKECQILPSGICRDPTYGLPLTGEDCSFGGVPECAPDPECEVLSEWLPDRFQSVGCCQENVLTCLDDHVVAMNMSWVEGEKGTGSIPASVSVLHALESLDLSFNLFEGTIPDEIRQLKKLATLDLEGNILNGSIPLALADLTNLKELNLADNQLTGAIPQEFEQLVNLESLYLQYNQLGGSLPESLNNIENLQVVDISYNLLLGSIDFEPKFDLIGLDSNLPLPKNAAELNITSGLKLSAAKVAMIAGITSAVLFIALVIGGMYSAIIARRREGKDTAVELKLVKKYTSDTKQIQLLKKLNTGGFGVVWKGRFNGELVAVKLIRMDKVKSGDDADPLRTVKMVVEEAGIMQRLTHDRIVKYIMFEMDSLAIVLEYLPWGSLYDYIGKTFGEMPWDARHQMMLDVCEGMAFLHSPVYASGKSKPILWHQDLKSANVLLAMEGNPPIIRGKISDFGLSCKLYLFL